VLLWRLPNTPKKIGDGPINVAPSIFNFQFHKLFEVGLNNFIVVSFYGKPRKVDVEQPHHFEILYS